MTSTSKFGSDMQYSHGEPVENYDNILDEDYPFFTNEAAKKEYWARDHNSVLGLDKLKAVPAEDEIEWRRRHE